MAGLQAAKKELRQAMRKTLAGISESSVHAQSRLIMSGGGAGAESNCAGQVVVDALLSLPEYRAARRIGVYLSMPSGEIATNAVVIDAFERDKTIFVPYIRKPSTRPVMDMVSLRSMEDYHSMKPDRWGIPTPSQDSIGGRRSCLAGPAQQAEDVDLIVMPGMAFDVDLGRVGHGKGYYDFFLARYQNSRRTDAHNTGNMPFLGMWPASQLLPLTTHPS